MNYISDVLSLEVLEAHPGGYFQQIIGDTSKEHEDERKRH